MSGSQPAPLGPEGPGGISISPLSCPPLTPLKRPGVNPWTPAGRGWARKAQRPAIRICKARSVSLPQPAPARPNSKTRSQTHKSGNSKRRQKPPAGFGRGSGRTPHKSTYQGKPNPRTRYADCASPRPKPAFRGFCRSLRAAAFCLLFPERVGAGCGGA